VEACKVAVYAMAEDQVLIRYIYLNGLVGLAVLQGRDAHTAMGSPRVWIDGRETRALVVILRVLPDDPQVHAIESVSVPVSAMLLRPETVIGAAGQPPRTPAVLAAG